MGVCLADSGRGRLLRMQRKRLVCSEVTVKEGGSCLLAG